MLPLIPRIQLTLDRVELGGHQLLLTPLLPRRPWFRVAVSGLGDPVTVASEARPAVAGSRSLLHLCPDRLQLWVDP